MIRNGHDSYRRTSGRSRTRVALAALVVLSLGAAACSKAEDDKGGSGSSGGSSDTTAPTERTTPLTYAEAKAQGVEGDYDWGPNCDTTTGRVKLPLVVPPPCVPVFEGDNGGETYQGVTADSIKVARYIAKADPQADALTRAAGAYDEDEDITQTINDYVEIYSSVMETYGRTVEAEPVQGTGGAAEDVPARADADKIADEVKAIAAFGGPTQTRAYAEQLARKGVMCVGSCLLAQPEAFYEETYPYVWVTGPSPDQAAAHTREFIEKQLAGKPAEFGGDDVNGKERTFALLTYDTPDGNFKPVWDQFAEDLEADGNELVTRVDYFLDIAKAQEDAAAIVAKLQRSQATTVVFSGDPFLPIYFTKEATAQGYFPEWVMAGTVYADTNVFGRQFDQEQWKHAMGVGLIPTRIDRDASEAIRLYKWYFGPDAEPPAENTAGIIEGNVRLLFTGISLAGPDLTPDTFGQGMFAAPLPDEDPSGLRSIGSYGDKGIWPTTDYAGLDNAGVIWWDPEAEGSDETGTEGKGMYRLVGGGVRYLPGEWPTDPIPLFDPEGTSTVYGPDEIPESLTVDVSAYPPPPGSPAAG